MKTLTYMLVLAVFGLVCRTAESADERFPIWTQSEWTNWMASVGITTVNTRRDGLSCDIMGQSSKGLNVIVNFAPDGRLGDLMISDLSLDFSTDGKIRASANCMALIQKLDGALHAAFEDVLWNDHRAAMFGNTQKHPWGTNNYVIGITTANKFWLERK